MHHVTIYREQGRFAGWPANYGIWSWGNEIVVCFVVGFADPNGGFHARDRSRPFETLQARSLDGGESWRVQAFPGRTPGGRALSADEHMTADLGVARLMKGEEAPGACEGGLDFAHPDFALICAKTGLRAGARSFFYHSTDRCGSWQGPFGLSAFGQTGIAARTDYLVSGPRECLLFLTSNKRDGREGRVFCAETINGGGTFEFISWIGPEPKGYSIMPASLRLSRSGILVAVRRQEAAEGSPGAANWIDLYRSEDNGRAWRLLDRPTENTGNGGNPPALNRLRDSRLCLTYGFRDRPFGIRARISEDDGDSWGDEIVLRHDSGNHDIGYPRTVQNADGRIVTAYYFNDRDDGERYVAATLWDPP